MTLYEEYYIKYREAVNLSKAQNPGHNLEVLPQVWITFKYLQDVNVEPWEREKMEILFTELYKNDEGKLADCLIAGIELIYKTMGEYCDGE